MANKSGTKIINKQHPQQVTLIAILLKNYNFLLIINFFILFIN